MGAWLYSSLPYRTAGPPPLTIPSYVSFQVRGVRSIAGDALTTIQGWCSFDIASRATLYRSTRIPCFEKRVSVDFGTVHSVRENGGRVFIKATYVCMHVCAPGSASHISLFNSNASICLWYKTLALKVAIGFDLRIFSDYQSFLLQIRPSRLDDDHGNRMAILWVNSFLVYICMNIFLFTYDIYFSYKRSDRLINCFRVVISRN